MTDPSTPDFRRPGLPWWWPSMRDILAVASTLIFFSAFLLPWFHKLPAEVSQTLGQYHGAIILQWGAVMGFYFGSSKSSAAKDTTISDMAKASTNG